MTGQECLDKLTQRISRYFDTCPLPAAPAFDYAGQLHMADEGYFLLPSLKTYSCQHHEFLWARICSQPLTLQQLEEAAEFCRQQMREYKTTTEHMNTMFTLVFICEQPLEPQVAAAISKLKFHKDYCFTLKGWSDLAVVAIDLQAGQRVSNKAANKLQEYFKFLE